MKKILELTFTLIAAAVILSGCVSVDYQVSVNKDGTGKISYVFGIQKNFLNQMQKSSEEMLASSKQQAETAGFTVSPYSDDKVEGFKASKDVPDITKGVFFPELFGSGLVKTSEDSNIKIEKGKFGTNYSQKGIIDLTGMKDMITYGITAQYSVTLPAQAGKSNASTVSEDKKTLTWQLKVGEVNNIEFTAEAPSMGMNIIIPAGIFAIGVITAIIIIIIKKVKK